MRNHLKHSLLHANWKTVVSESLLGLWVLSSYVSYALVLLWQTVWEECKCYHSRSHSLLSSKPEERDWGKSVLLFISAGSSYAHLTGAQGFPVMQEVQSVCPKLFVSRTLMHQRFIYLQIFWSSPNITFFFFFFPHTAKIFRSTLHCWNSQAFSLEKMQVFVNVSLCSVYSFCSFLLLVIGGSLSKLLYPGVAKLCFALRRWKTAAMTF